jgi:RNA polymerase sigma factor (sigma-70 family)
MQSREDQRDLVQETFVKAFAEKARHAYDNTMPYRPYLLRIAKNLMIDRLRKLGREILLGDDDAGRPLLEIIHDQNHALLPEGEGDLDMRRLRDAVADFLSHQPRDRALFVRLRFLDGLSQIEVAKALGVTRRRIRTEETRVKDALFLHLQESDLLELLRQQIETQVAD